LPVRASSFIECHERLNGSPAGDIPLQQANNQLPHHFFVYSLSGKQNFVINLSIELNALTGKTNGASAYDRMIVIGVKMIIFGILKYQDATQRYM
jgi:hypothetical protein